MDTESLKSQLAARIAALEHQGLIDDHLRICLDLKDTQDLPFFVNLVPSFFMDAHESLRKMTMILNQSDVDFYNLDQQTIKLLGGSGCIGARRMREECSTLRLAIDKKSKEGCIMALNNLKHEFHNLHGQMGAVLQVERELVSRQLEDKGGC